MHARRQRELDLGVVHLLHHVSPRLRGGDRLDPDDLDAVRAGAVTSSHIPVTIGHGIAGGHVPVLAVHVVGARPENVNKNTC